MVGAANRYVVPNAQIKRDVYLDMINGMSFGDSPKQGVRSGWHFYHADMGFAVSFPEGWQINNLPDRVQAVADGGKAFIEMTASDLNRRLSPAQFMKQRLGVERLKAGQVLNNNGLEGYTGLVDAESGGLVRISVLYLDEKAYIFISATKDKRLFNQFDAGFLSTANSFHRLRKDERALAQGQKLVVKTVGRQDSYRSWSKSTPITNSPL